MNSEKENDIAIRARKLCMRNVRKDDLNDITGVPKYGILQ